MVQKEIKGRGAPALHKVDNSIMKRIPKNKDELKTMEQADTYRMIKIKQGEVKNKVGSFRHELDQALIKSRLKDRIEKLDQMGGGTDPQYFSIDHPRTK